MLCAVSVIFASYKGYPEFSSRIIEMVDTYHELTTKEKVLVKSNFGKLEKLKGQEHYKKIVVIIGESMRRDFMSTYGFKLNTMPHVDSMNKIVLKNFVSPAANTLASVPRFLTIVNEDGSYQPENNAVELAKLAGYETWWITDQGKSELSVSATLLSKYADYSYFSPYQLDMLMMPKIENALKSDKDQVIFVHINGQHENPCSKLGDFPIAYDFNAGKTLNCYVSTYHVTDTFIYEISKLLEKYSDSSYAMLYFADHGLNFEKDFNKFSIRRDSNIKQSYEVPLVFFSSSLKETSYIDAMNSGYNLIHYLSKLFGVRVEKLKADYDIFSKSNNITPKVFKYEDGTPIAFDNLNDGYKAMEIISK